VLPAERRVRRREDFTAAVRDGRRVGASGLVLHVRTDAGEHPARAGFIVGRTFGSAVARNRLRRRLRHLVAPHLERAQAGTVLVIRATPPAADQTGSELAAALETLLGRALGATLAGAVT
jgi:ribonuclease P protein component